MGVTERLAVSWEDASFAVITALAWLFVSLVSCRQVSVEFVSQAGIEIVAAIPLLGPVLIMIEDDDREFREDDLELCGPRALSVGSPPSLALLQIMPPQSAFLSFLIPAQHPLRC
jgi:hypothetical protein